MIMLVIIIYLITINKCDIINLDLIPNLSNLAEVLFDNKKYDDSE